MMIKKIVFLILISFTNLSFGGLVLGTGFSSATSGRISPTIYTGLDFPQFAMTVSSVGVKNSYYYHSAYNLIMTAQKDFPQFLFGTLRGGVGIGVHFAKRELSDGTNTTESNSDSTFGPAFRLTWEFLPDVIIGVDAIFGYGNSQFLMLNTRNVHSLIFGVRF